MNSGWDRAKDLMEAQQREGGIFVRLANNGDKVVGAFCGDPYARQSIWIDDHSEIYDANNPAHRGSGKKPSLKVAINFFVPADNTMKVIEVGTVTFRDIVKCREKFPLGKWLFEIERHGESGSTKTKYSVLPDGEIDAATRAKIATAELHDLERVVAGGDDDEGEGRSQAQADGPVDAATAAELVARMKVLPRAKVDELLKQLGAGRIRDLTRSKAERAREMLAKLEGAARAPEEVDPFA